MSSIDYTFTFDGGSITGWTIHNNTLSTLSGSTTGPYYDDGSGTFPAGSLNVDGTSITTTENTYIQWQGTWYDLGVPADATITNVTLSFLGEYVADYTSGTSSGAYTINNGSGTLLATLYAGRGDMGAADTVYYTSSGTTQTISAIGSDTLQFRINQTLVPTSNFYYDQLKLTVEFTPATFPALPRGFPIKGKSLQIDYNHTISRGLVLDATYHEGGGNPHNLVDKTVGSIVSGLNQTWSPYSELGTYRDWSLVNTSSYDVFSHPSFKANYCSFEIWFKLRSFQTTSPNISGLMNSFNALTDGYHGGFGIYIGDSSLPNNQPVIFNNNTSLSLNYLLQTNTVYQIIGICSDSGNTFYINGIPVSTSGTLDLSNTSTNANTLTYVGTDYNGINCPDGKIMLIRRWNRPLIENEVRQLWTNPFCIYKKIQHNKFGSGGISPITGSGALSKQLVLINADGTFTIPNITGSGNLTLNHFGISADGTVLSPAFTGDGSVILNHPTISGNGSFSGAQQVWNLSLYIANNRVMTRRIANNNDITLQIFNHFIETVQLHEGGYCHYNPKF